MKLSCLIILIVLMTIPAYTQILAPPPTPAELEYRARIEADRRAPIIAMHGHWHDDYFEVGLNTPYKNKVLSSFAHYTDKLKPLPPIETLLDKICSPAERGRIFFDDTEMSKLPKHFFTLTVPAEEQAEYLRQEYLSITHSNIKGRYHKLDRINDAISTRERILEQRAKIYRDTVAACEKYLIEHPEIKAAIRLEAKEAALKTWQGMKEANVEGWQDIQQKDLGHKEHIQALIDRKYELIEEKEFLAREEKILESAQKSYENNIENKKKNIENSKYLLYLQKSTVKSQQKSMQESAQKWAKTREEIIKSEPELTSEVMAQE